MKNRTYTVLRGNEECQCEQCGFPMYVGDRVYTTKHEQVACGSGCAKRLEEDSQ